MRPLKKLCCTLLVSLLCLSFVTPVLAASTPGFQAFTKTNLGAYEKFTDIDQSKWYGSSKQGVIKTACELNILNGMSPTKFDPEGTLRLNEAVKIACVIHALYTGQADPLQPGTGKHWADPYLAYAEANGILQKDEFTNYDRPATRSEMAHIFAKSLPEDGLKKINTILSINDVERDDLSPVPYAADIFKLYRAGVLAGEPKTHDFRPDSTITRAETAAIVARLALPETREKFDNFLHRGFYTDIPGFTLTNTRTGKTLSPGQRPYEERAACRPHNRSSGKGKRIAGYGKVPQGLGRGACERAQLRPHGGGKRRSHDNNTRPHAGANVQRHGGPGHNCKNKGCRKNPRNRQRGYIHRAERA